MQHSAHPRARPQRTSPLLRLIPHKHARSPLEACTEWAPSPIKSATLSTHSHSAQPTSNASTDLLKLAAQFFDANGLTSVHFRHQSMMLSHLQTALLNAVTPDFHRDDPESDTMIKFNMTRDHTFLVSSEEEIYYEVDQSGLFRFGALRMANIMLRDERLFVHTEQNAIWAKAPEGRSIRSVTDHAAYPRPLRGSTASSRRLIRSMVEDKRPKVLPDQTMQEFFGLVSRTQGLVLKRDLNTAKGFIFEGAESDGLAVMLKVALQLVLEMYANTCPSVMLHNTTSALILGLPSRTRSIPTTIDVSVSHLISSDGVALGSRPEDKFTILTALIALAAVDSDQWGLVDSTYQWLAVPAAAASGQSESNTGKGVRKGGPSSSEKSEGSGRLIGKRGGPSKGPADSTESSASSKIPTGNSTVKSIAHPGGHGLTESDTNSILWGMDQRSAAMDKTEGKVSEYMIKTQSRSTGSSTSIFLPRADMSLELPARLRLQPSGLFTDHDLEIHPPGQDHLNSLQSPSFSYHLFLGTHIGSGRLGDVFEGSLYLPHLHQSAQIMKSVPRDSSDKLPKTRRSDPPSGSSRRHDSRVKSRGRYSNPESALSHMDIDHDGDLPGTVLSRSVFGNATVPPSPSDATDFTIRTPQDITFGQVTSIPAAIKICVPSHFPPTGWTSLTRSSGEYTTEEAQRHFANEAGLYARILNELDDVAPKCFGSWHGQYQDTEIIVLVMERLGAQVSESWRNLSTLERDELVRLYSRLHSAGIVHHDVSTRNVCRSALGAGLRLVDFENSAVGSEEEIAFEAYDVERFIGLR